MALFPITERTDMDLELTRGIGKPFPKPILEKLETQEIEYEKIQKEKIIDEKIIAISALIPLAIIAYLVLKK